MARPSDFTPELADLICSKLAEGESLRTVCLAADMPDKATVFRWLRTNAAFCDQYTRAKEESADALTDEMLSISDDATNDWMERRGKEGESIGWEVNSEHIQRSRLRIETRKWLAAKLKPKKYGERIEHTGEIIQRHVREISDAELADLAARGRSGASESSPGASDTSGLH